MVVNSVSELYFITRWHGIKPKGENICTSHFVVSSLPQCDHMSEFISQAVAVSPVADVCSCLEG